MKSRFFRMNIEVKLIVYSIISITIPILILYNVSNSLVTGQLEKLQEERVASIRRNILLALDNEMQNLHIDNIDYSHWSDMYDGVETRDYAWLKDVFTIQSSHKKVELIYILDKQGNIVFVNEDVDGFYRDAKKFINIARTGREFATLADIGNELFIISLAQIVDHGFTEKSNGILIMGRKLDKEILEKFPSSYNFSSDFIYNGKGIVDENTTISKAKGSVSVFSHKKDVYERVHIDQISDYTNSSVAYLYIKENGSFIEDTRASFQKGLITAICITYVLGMLLLYFIRSNIMKPIKVLRDKVKQLRGNEAVQVNKTTDELTTLTEEFEIMSNELQKHARDIEAKNEELEYLVYRDDITGCYNKRYFRTYLKYAFYEAKMDSSTVSVILIDIDHFRHYGEVAGRQQLDNTLRVISDIISRIVDEVVADNGRVCFDGTDEFRIILNRVDYKQALDTINEITKEINEHSFLHMERMPGGRITVSCGMANYPKDAVDMEQLMDAAQDRLIRTKYHNKGKVGYFYTIFNTLKNDIDEGGKAITYMSKAFLSVIDAMDEYTYTHTEGVVKYSSIIADQLGIDDTEKENIRVAALLHDIGKLELGRDILNKKEKLTSEDIEFIKQHPIFAVNMLKPLQIFDGIIDMVKHHHERYDGKGYPYGLSGGDIPMGARVIAIADSFDAMTTTRAYRTTHMSYEQALEEIKKNSGTQFDPDIVKAFIEYIDKNGFNFLLLD